MTLTRQTLGARTLAAKYYTAPGIYDIETERIFDRSWQCAGRVDDAAETGDYFLAEIDGESLIVTRGRGGAIHCHHNVCRHRGTRLCDEERGCFSKTIRCPYHGWAYDLDGRLAAAPNMNGQDGFDRTGFPLKSVPTTVFDGFVFVNPSVDAVPLVETYAAIIGHFDRWSLSKLRSVARRTYDVDANWKLLFQNYNECYHCPRIHPQLNARSNFTTATNDFTSGPFLGGPMELADGSESLNTTGQACGPIFSALNSEDRRRVYYFSLFPTLLISPHPDFVLVHRIERLGIGTTRVTCDFLFHPDSIDAPGFDSARAVEFWDLTNRQDWHVCELSQRGIASRAYEPGPYSGLESIVAAFDRHYLKTIDGDE